MCLYPIDIFVKPKRLKNLVPLVDNGVFEYGIDYREKVTVCCGKCLECLQQKSIEWAFRILDECSQYENNAFITLTYNDEHLFYSDDVARYAGVPSVNRREVQLFMKRFRKALSPLKVRFFACGEYGRKFGRPHYHIIVFNWFPDDAVFFKMEEGQKLYRSKFLERVWSVEKKNEGKIEYESIGFSSVGKVTYKTALYCAKYMNKFQSDKYKREQKSTYDRHVVLPAPSFIQMSNRPGIGYNAVYRCDLKTDRIYRDGKSTKIPRYYLKVMERDGVFLDDFRELRKKQGEIMERCTDLDIRRKKFQARFNREVIIKE